MCQVPCTHLWNVQDSSIWIWKRSRNARLFIIIGGSLQKLSMDGRLLHNHKIWKLKLKLYLSSQIQHLTLFYFGFVCNLSTLYYTNIYKFLFITLVGIFCGKWCLECFYKESFCQLIILWIDSLLYKILHILILLHLVFIYFFSRMTYVYF